MKYIGKFIGWLVIGFIVVAVGVGTAVSGLPGDFDDGNTTTVVFGALIAAVGQMIVLVCTIALGVFLGTREAHFEQADV